jgi:hypothetical protein
LINDLEDFCVKLADVVQACSKSVYDSCVK